ncbi:MAG TPA: transcription termination/antitermination protein NusG [Pirellulales bacterium]|nr:transcription termination/antitermination protein NusG [Pirellulales bacterium]
MTDELNDLLSGPDEGLPEPAAHGLAGNGDAARRLTSEGEQPDDASGHADPSRSESDQAELDQAAAPRTPPAETSAVESEVETSAGSEAAHASAEESADEAPPKPAKPRPPRPPIEDLSEERKPIKKEWYILKVQSNREDSIADALQRRIAIADLGEYFDEIIVPTEKVSEFKGGKKRVVKRKIYPGYIVVHMELNDDTWFLVRETPGIGDFTGSGGKPTPMLPHEVNKIVAKQEEKAEQEIRTVIPFSQGDRVRINEGTFENFEGDVDNIDQANGRVTIMINIFGRSTPVELEYWQVEKL